MKTLIVAVALIICFCAGMTEAKNEMRLMVPKDQFDSRTRLWLARAMIGEAGWLAVNDHVAIAYVLKRRWDAMRERWPKIRFQTVILAYAKALGGGRREYTVRQLWIRDLNIDLSEPQGWPQKVSWKNHTKYWIQTLDRVDQWVRGELSDPCRGRVFHWGAYFDLPTPRMYVIDCGETKNIFYGVSDVENGSTTKNNRGTVLEKGFEN